MSTAPWVAPPEVKTPGNEVIPANLDFFFPPPTNIGTITHAWSEVKKGRTLLPRAVKIGIGMAGLAALIFHTVWLSQHRVPGQKASPIHLFLYLFEVAFFALPMLSAIHANVVAYLGTEGAAIYKTQGTREDAKLESFRFEEVAEMTFKKTKTHKGTETWTLMARRADGSLLMKFTGHFTNFGSTKNGARPMYLLGKALEETWAARRASKSQS